MFYVFSICSDYHYSSNYYFRAKTIGNILKFLKLDYSKENYIFPVKGIDLTLLRYNFAINYFLMLMLKSTIIDFK